MHGELGTLEVPCILLIIQLLVEVSGSVQPRTDCLNQMTIVQLLAPETLLWKCSTKVNSVFMETVTMVSCSVVVWLHEI